MRSLRDVLGRLRQVQPCAQQRSLPANSPTAELHELMNWKNGFYAYRRGFHAFGYCSEPRYHSIDAWNASTGWVREYGSLASGLFFFAEDSFGDQFAWADGRVVRFSAETGAVEHLADTVVDFFLRLSAEPEEELGLTVLDKWIRRHGELPEGRHLFPRTPLVLGGSLDPTQIVTVDPFENMRFKADLARQIADVPDGGKVELVVAPPPTDSRR